MIYRMIRVCAEGLDLTRHSEKSDMGTHKSQSHPTCALSITSWGGASRPSSALRARFRACMQLSSGSPTDTETESSTIRKLTIGNLDLRGVYTLFGYCVKSNQSKYKARGKPRSYF